MVRRLRGTQRGRGISAVLCGIFALVAGGAALSLTAPGCADLSGDCELAVTCPRFASGSGGGGEGGAGGGGSGGAAIGTVGEPCSPGGALACAGHAQQDQVICGDDGKWAANGACSADKRCDSTPGPDQGTCKAPVPECAMSQPGDTFCDKLDRVACGPDLVTKSTLETCPFLCTAGACTGECVPNSPGCVGNAPATCDAEGVLQAGQPCGPEAPICSGGACILPPSCAGLATDCGPGKDETCCASEAVTGGTYNRSNDAKAPATVSDFRLDRFEITVARFRKFVEAYPSSKPVPGGGAHPLIKDSGWAAAWDAALAPDQAGLTAAVKCDGAYQTWTDTAGSNEGLPMNCLTWYEAFAFCAWDGGRLPTEAEWNLAAAGGDEQREYPWGSGLDGSRAAYDCTGDGSGAGACAFADILPVGSKSGQGDGKWKHADLAGGVAEWTLDGFLDPYAADCKDCADLADTAARVLRGGGWDDAPAAVTSSARGKLEPIGRDRAAGVRCARGL